MKFIIHLLVLLFGMISVANAQTEWHIIPSESKLIFSGIQNNAPVSGEFKKFSGKIFFDPTNLKESHITIKVDTASISTAYQDLTDTLIMPEWLNIKLFPFAVFKTNEIHQLSDKTYEAKGSLSIQDKTKPITLIFSEEENTGNKVKIKGKGMFKRSDFDLGKGEWKATDLIKDEIQINFIVSATK